MTGSRPRQEHQPEAGVGDAVGVPVALLLAPGAILVLAFHQELGTFLIPVEVAEILVAAGDADALDAVERVIRMAVAELLPVLADPLDGPVDVLIAIVAGAVDAVVVVDELLRDEQAGQARRGHGDGAPAPVLVLLIVGLVCPTPVARLMPFPGLLLAHPVVVGNLNANLRKRPYPQHAVLADAVIVPAVGFGHAGARVQEVGIETRANPRLIDSAKQILLLALQQLAVGVLDHGPDLAAEAQGIDADDVGMIAEPVDRRLELGRLLALVGV